MLKILGIKRVSFGIIFLCCLFIPVVKPARATETGDCLKTISGQTARSIQLTLEHVAQSIKSLGDAYVRAYLKTRPMNDQEKALWMKSAIEEGKTVRFQPFRVGPEPGFQASVPAYYFYNGRNVSLDIIRQLKTFVFMGPLFRTAYETFDYSWVYLTTVDEAFMIYPYLPLKEAVNNLPPTEQVYYKVADFSGRNFGWEEPYLDLAGAGMMVTVSYPIYTGENLLGVVSRDITLSQLSRRLLKPVAGRSGNLISLIMNKDGLAIGANRTSAVKEIDSVNARAGAAVLYYRNSEGRNALKSQKVICSSNALFDAVGEDAVVSATKEPNKGLWQLNVKVGERIYKAAAAKVPATGWLLVTVDVDR